MVLKKIVQHKQMGWRTQAAHFPSVGGNAKRTGTSAGGFTKTPPSLASRWKNAGQQTEAGGANYGIRGEPSPCKCQGSCAATVAALSSAMVREYAEHILEQGPKFSYEPAASHPQLPAIVHHVAERTSEQDWEQARSNGITLCCAP